MEWIRYFIFLEALIAMFLAGGLFFKEANLKSRTISLLMAMFGVHMLIFVYGSSELTNLYPVFKSWFYYEIGFYLVRYSLYICRPFCRVRTN